MRHKLWRTLLVKALNARDIAPYWFSDLYIHKTVNEYLCNFDVAKNYNIGDLPEIPFGESDIIPFLYQFGILSIKKYNPIIGVYTIGVPNDDIRKGISDSIFCRW